MDTITLRTGFQASSVQVKCIMDGLQNLLKEDLGPNALETLFNKVKGIPFMPGITDGPLLREYSMMSDTGKIRETVAHVVMSAVSINRGEITLRSPVKP
jgi:hypothetical protein